MIIRIGFFVKAIATWHFVNRNKKIPVKRLCKPSDGDSNYGAGNGTRTHDLRITNALLYQLSYTSKEICKNTCKGLTYMV